MATHPSILAWRIPWTEEPGGLQSIGSQRVGHDQSDLACTQGLFHTLKTVYWGQGPDSQRSGTLSEVSLKAAKCVPSQTPSCQGGKSPVHSEVMSRTRVDQPGVPPRTWNFSPGKVGLCQPGRPEKSDSQTPPDQKTGLGTVVSSS